MHKRCQGFSLNRCPVILFPNAKINIGLNVVGLRPDGYHDIESVFVPIGLSDVLELAVPDGDAPEWVLETSGNPVAVAPEKNLCIKALRALKNVVDVPPVAIHLHKEIPDGAGLGGGSADAAFVLRGLNDMLSLGVPDDILRSVAARIGADCSFFIDCLPSYRTGIGDVADAVDLACLRGMRIVLAVPNGAVSTAEAYAHMPVRRPSVCVKDAILRDVTEWRNIINNDFEPYVESRIPDVALFKKIMYEHGALYAQMSGSGSSVFGLFPGGLEDGQLPVWAEFPNARCFWSGKMSL